MDQKCTKILPILESGGDLMVKADLWHEIHSRYKLKESKKSIARSIGVSVQTVRRILSQEQPVQYQRKRKEKTVVAPYGDYILQRLAAVGYCAQSIFEELQEKGYTGSYDQVKRFVRPFREEAHREATTRFETPPGKQSQVDWGQCWTSFDDQRRRIHIFVMSLGYSRRFFTKGTSNEKLPTFLDCHKEAFDFFGGLTHDIVYDNAKTVVLSRDFEGKCIQWNASFWDFSRHYGYQARLCRPYRAQTKGKVESGIKYVKRFLRGKSFRSLTHLNEALMRWTVNVADQRIHGTTHQKPIDRFREEKDLLLDHRRIPPYMLQERVIRHVAKDCMINFQTNRYSVPFRFVGKEVEVQCDSGFIRIYFDGELIAAHSQCLEKHQICIENSHYEGIYQRRDNLPFYFKPDSHDDVEVRDLAFYETLVEGGTQ